MKRDPKTELLAHVARVGAALAHHARLHLLDVLAQGEHTVESLVAKSGIPLKSTSAHLRALREAGLVAHRRDGTYLHYRLADSAVHELLTALIAVAERRSTEVRELTREFFNDPDGLEPVTSVDLRRRLARGDVTLIDVRPEDEFHQAHIRGARSIPLGKLNRLAADLPPNREIVAYCRGPVCLLAATAVRRLRRAGFTASLLRDGVPEWDRRGFPVARPSDSSGLLS